MAYLSTLGELALGSRFKALSDALYDAADAVYRARGSKVQGRWFPVLRLLHDRGPTSVSEVAAAIGQTHSAVSQVSARLAREGLVRHASDRSDGRRRVLALTPKGEAALRELKPVWHEIRTTVARLLHILRDMNAKSVDSHRASSFSEVISAVKAKLAGD